MAAGKTDFSISKLCLIVDTNTIEVLQKDLE